MENTKKFILKCGRIVIDISVFLSYVLVIIIGAIQGINIHFGLCLLTYFIGFILVTLTYFTIYLLISINDNLCEINAKLSKNQNN